MEPPLLFFWTFKGKKQRSAPFSSWVPYVVVSFYPFRLWNRLLFYPFKYLGHFLLQLLLFMPLLILLFFIMGPMYAVAELWIEAGVNQDLTIVRAETIVQYALAPINATLEGANETLNALRGLFVVNNLMIERMAQTIEFMMFDLAGVATNNIADFTTEEWAVFSNEVIDIADYLFDILWHFLGTIANWSVHTFAGFVHGIKLFLDIRLAIP